jgi:hypothetical protein
MKTRQTQAKDKRQSPMSAGQSGKLIAKEVSIN